MSPFQAQITLQASEPLPSLQFSWCLTYFLQASPSLHVWMLLLIRIITPGLKGIMQIWYKARDLNLTYSSSKPLVLPLNCPLESPGGEGRLKILLPSFHSRDTDLSGKGCSLGIWIFISSQVTRCAAKLETRCPKCCHSTMATLCHIGKVPREVIPEIFGVVLLHFCCFEF